MKKLNAFNKCKEELTFFTRNTRNPVPSFIKDKNLILIISGFFILMCFTACQGSGIKYDIDKQKTFQNMFVIGSSREEVEKQLENLDGIEFSQEFILTDGDIGIFYRTSLELYGTFGYSFVFSNDQTLKYVIPQEFTD